MNSCKRALLLAVIGAGLAVAPGCGSDSPADQLMGEPGTVPDAGATLDAESEAAAEAGQDAPLEDAFAEDAPSEDAAVEVANPFEPPAIELIVWNGKLPPGALGDPRVRVTLPKDAPPGAKYPLLVFAHGFQLGEGDYAGTFEHIARFGFVVASTDFDAPLIDPDHHAVVVAMQRTIDFLTQSPPAEVGDVVDADRIAVMGHSLGGKGALWTALEDTRVKAIVALDPVDDDPSPIPSGSPKRPSITPELMGSMAVPALYVASQLGPTGGQPCAPPASNACRFAEATPSGVPAWSMVLEGFGHLQFVDNFSCLQCFTCAKGTQNSHVPLQVIMRGMSTAFLQHVLRQETGYIAYLEGARRQELEAASLILDAQEQSGFCAQP